MFPEYVRVNTRDLRLAIEAGMGPMSTFFDERCGGLPFFGNAMTGTDAGNSHHESFSMAHIPGRWLNALLFAEDVLGIPADAEAIETLRRWAYRSLTSAGIGFPACLNLDEMTAKKETDLHNLREVMHALYALTRYRGDDAARTLGLSLIDAVDRYFDDEVCALREAEYTRDTGAKVQCWSGTHRYKSPFPVTFGRYIGPLVKFYLATGEPAALRQALRLKDACFAHVLNARGDYDVEVFGGHTHSTTAMISSLALLGEATGDRAILKRVRRFMENGLSQIAVDFGWCIEGYQRADCVGEVNNTADILETCLVLARAGYAGYFARAERILRAHLLPSQLLDTCFVPADDDPAHIARYRLNERAKGAFGFPCPYGHEYEPGALVSFNWDIVGGATEGLCEAYCARTSRDGRFISVNLLFDVDDEDLTFTSPYGAEDTATLTLKREGACVRVRVPSHCAAVVAEGCERIRQGEWLYLLTLRAGERVRLRFHFEREREYVHFRQHCFCVEWRGEEVCAMDAPGKRLKFFPPLNEQE